MSGYHSGAAYFTHRWGREPPAAVHQTTSTTCGCRTLEFHSEKGWAAQPGRAGSDQVEAREQPFTIMSLRDFLRDKGQTASLHILGKLVRRRANIQRLSENWAHFVRYAD